MIAPTTTTKIVRKTQKMTIESCTCDRKLYIVPSKYYCTNMYPIALIFLFPLSAR